MVSAEELNQGEAQQKPFVPHGTCSVANDQRILKRVEKFTLQYLINIFEQRKRSIF